MRLCNQYELPIVPQGGLTGLSGGAVPVSGGVALSTDRMSGIISVDPDNFCLTAWAGTPLETVQNAAREFGLEYPVDIGARGSATVGGTIATNAGGIRVIRHGMTRQHVLGLEVVLADGTVLSNLRSMIKDNAGYDLKQIFIGSEGTLGIVTRAVLKLCPAPTQRNTALLGLADYASGLACLGSARRSFEAQLTAFEGMWPYYWDLATSMKLSGRAPLKGGHGLYVLLETSGHDLAAFEEWLAECFESGLVEDGAIAQSLSDINDFWSVREAIGEVDHVIGPHLNFDIGLQPSALGEFVSVCEAALTDLATGPTLYVGHIGDGNLHVIVPVREHSNDYVWEIENRVFGILSEREGTVTAEHGVGLLKRDWLNRTRRPEEIQLMRHLKSCLDPKSLLNPGKVIPT
jgi:FAD/FMN-containing dehydrogenase